MAIRTTYHIELKIQLQPILVVLEMMSKSENYDQHNVAKLYRRAISPTQQICPHAKNVHKQTFPSQKLASRSHPRI